MSTPTPIKVKDLLSIRAQITFLFSRQPDGKYIQIESKASEKLSRKLLVVKRALRPIDTQIDDLRDAHLEKGEDGNFKVENNAPVYKQESGKATLSKLIKELDDSEVVVALGEPIAWELLSGSNVNGDVLTELCLLGVVADPKD